MGHKKIKAVVFDFGGVISINKSGPMLAPIAEVLKIPLEDFRKAYQV